MIAFGGLVAVLLIFMPRGILDERRVHLLRTFLRTTPGGRRQAETHGAAGN